MAMRYTAEDEARLKATVSAFNKKVRRLEKAGKVAPEKLSLPIFRKEITETRQDFNRELRRLERFQRENAEKPHTFKEYGITVTHWEAVEVARQISINNRKRARIKEKINITPITLRGEPITGPDGKQLVRAQMGSPLENSFKPKQVNLNKTYTKKAFQELQKSVMKEAKAKYFEKRDEAWKKSYIKALRAQYSKNDLKELEAKIKGMKIDEFVSVMRSDQDTNIGWGISHFNMIQLDEKLKGLKSIWIPETNTETIPIKK